MSILTSWLASPPPDAALELAPDSVSGAVISARGSDATVQSFAFEPLPSGALVPSLTGQNLVDRKLVHAPGTRAVSLRVRTLVGARDGELHRLDQGGLCLAGRERPQRIDRALTIMAGAVDGILDGAACAQ